MKQKVPAMFKYRNELLKISTDQGLPSSILLKYTEPMRGKTDEEKEQMAKEAIKDIERKALKKD